MYKLIIKIQYLKFFNEFEKPWKYITETIIINFSDLLEKDGKNTATLLVNLTSCLLANISYCEASTKNAFMVAVSNPLSRVVTDYIRLPVNSTEFNIIGPEGKLIK